MPKNQKAIQPKPDHVADVSGLTRGHQMQPAVVMNEVAEKPQNSWRNRFGAGLQSAGAAFASPQEEEWDNPRHYIIAQRYRTRLGVPRISRIG